MTNPSNRDVDIEDVAKMIQLLREAGWREATLKMGDFELRVSDGSSASSAAPAPAPAMPIAAAPAAAPALTTPETSGQDPSRDTSKDVVVRAQSLGAFWRSPQPGAPAFVEVGDHVDDDSPLGIVEVMKMMTRVVPGHSGTVVAIHVENGDMVEFDQALFTVAPD